MGGDDLSGDMTRPHKKQKRRTRLEASAEVQGKVALLQGGNKIVIIKRKGVGEWAGLW